MAQAIQKFVDDFIKFIDTWSAVDLCDEDFAGIRKAAPTYYGKGMTAERAAAKHLRWRIPRSDGMCRGIG